MVRAVASTDVTERVSSNPASGNTYHTSHFFGQDRDAGGPQGFLVHFRKPGGVIKPHFHPVDQFQVVMRGDGRLGKHQLDQIAVHYTDGYTPYGPIVAGENGIGFLTIRATPDYTGSNYMPASREKMRPHKAGRSLACHVAVNQLPAESEPCGVVHEVLIEPCADGLAAFVARARAGSEFVASDPPGGLGQYCVVISGSVLHEGRELQRESCLWVGPDDEPPQLVAGPAGAEVLVLQFPRKAA